MAHTQGKWKVITANRCGRSFVIEANDFYDVAVVRNIGPEDNEANARLIAAAPQLLAALKAIERAESPNNVQSWDMAMEQVRAAIKAAEG